MKNEHMETFSRIAEAIESRRFAPRMKAALRRILSGDSYRTAARLEGVGYRELHANAKTVPGLLAAHRAAWRESWGEHFPPMWRHHTARSKRPQKARKAG